LFGTDWSEYDPSGQSESPEDFPLFNGLHYDTPDCGPFDEAHKASENSDCIEFESSRDFGTSFWLRTGSQISKAARMEMQ
jgi:hypothetical protein